MITPRRSLTRHRVFKVVVSDFVAVPTEPDPSDFTTAAFFITPDGSATAPQPDNAHRIFPSNDHPRDKASYSFRVDTPSDIVAVTNGVLLSKRTRGDRTIWTYVQRQPMASELIQLGRRQLRPDRARPSPRRHPARRHGAQPDGLPGGQDHARERPPRLHDRPGGPLPVRRLRLVRGGHRDRVRPRDPDHVDLRPPLVRRPQARACGSRRWSTSWRTSGSATACRPGSGATCG